MRSLRQKYSRAAEEWLDTWEGTGNLIRPGKKAGQSVLQMFSPKIYFRLHLSKSA